MTKIQFRGMSFFFGDDGRGKYRTLALAEIYLPDIQMTIHDVRLAWSEERGYLASAPITSGLKRPPVIFWHHEGDFGRDLTNLLLDKYEGMGGEMPAPRPKPVFRRNAAGKIVGLAKPEPIEHRFFPATFTLLHEEANDNEAVEGLARTLSAEQEEVRRVLG